MRDRATGIDSKRVAQQMSVAQQTVSKWRNRFATDRLDGLLDAPRPGAPRTIDDTRVDAVIAKTLETVGVILRLGVAGGGADQWHGGTSGGGGAEKCPFVKRPLVKGVVQRRCATS